MFSCVSMLGHFGNKILVNELIVDVERRVLALNKPIKRQRNGAACHRSSYYTRLCVRCNLTTQPFPPAETPGRSNLQ